MEEIRNVEFLAKFHDTTIKDIVERIKNGEDFDIPPSFNYSGGFKKEKTGGTMIDHILYATCPRCGETVKLLNIMDDTLTHCATTWEFPDNGCWNEMIGVQIKIDFSHPDQKTKK